MNAEAGISHPKDLEGKTLVGGSLQTDIDLHLMALLRDVFDVDLSTIHFIATNDNHVAQARPSKNSELRMGASVAEILESGEAAACITSYNGKSDKVKPLLTPDQQAAAREWWMARNHCTPIHHTIVISNELLATREGLADDFYQAFVAAKQPFLAKINAHEDIFEEMSKTVLGPAHDYGITSQDQLILPDPIPYGVEANRGPLETLLSMGYDNGYLSKAWTPEEIFATLG
jgi:4,5-dihydroxyphthalate decarboxylase